MTEATKSTKKRVTFEVRAEPGKKVFVAGTFNNWHSKQKRLKEKGGVYAVSLLLPKGKYEYKFIIDDVWVCDPECPEWIPDGLGSLNSVLMVE